MSSSSLRIAYIGPVQGTSLHRAKALERLGHSVTHIDPWGWLGSSPWVARWRFHTGALGIPYLIDKRLYTEIAASKPELIFVNQGEFLGPKLLSRCRSLAVPIVNYTNDNPFSGRDGQRFRYYLKALSKYDLLAVPRFENMAQAVAEGAGQVMRVWFTADEVAQERRAVPAGLKRQYASEVTFIGTWFPERGPFIAELVRRGVPLSIWGDRWQKAREWPVIAPFWRGGGIYRDAEYAAAIQSSRICLGLLSKGNRDLHTRRSIEVPALGVRSRRGRTLRHDFRLHQKRARLGSRRGGLLAGEDDLCGRRSALYRAAAGDSSLGGYRQRRSAWADGGGFGDAGG